ncbi:MAG: DNA alkylation repair protein [Candidatus Gracilibacteria bacterium]
MISDIKKDLSFMMNPEKAAFFPYFFKTGKGEYGEGDQFLGVTVPQQRIIAKKYVNLANLKDIAALLESPIHEHRLTALLILVYKNEKASPEEKKAIFDFYLAHTKGINNWDLVDASARSIVGDYLLSAEKKDKTPKLLIDLSHSKDLWERRIAIVATYAYIKKGIISPTFEITELLMKDAHDLIHKACGWMLRETGKKDIEALIEFVEKHKAVMPRTMLRYAIERMDKETKVELMKR